MIKNHQAITVNKFNGLFARGRQDAVPIDHFADCLNVKYTQDEVDVRDGFALSLAFATPIVRAYVYKIYGQADRILFLDNTGKIWDSTNLGTPILNIATMTDFAFVNIFGRAYLSPINLAALTGLAANSLYVYNGSGMARLAAGSAPTGTLTAVNSATSGHVEAGFHLFAVAFETDTGFITPPGPTTFPSVTATGSLSVDIGGIPVGGSSISYIRLMATKVIQNYNGNQAGYQFFFVPNGRLANGTTSATVSFFDVDLLTSGDASYLFNLYTTIPAMLWLTTYNGRLIGGGENTNPSVIRVSEAGQPEVVNQLTGLIVVDPANTSSPVTNGQEYRGQFYITKRTRTYSTNDNGGNPTTWQVITLDEGIGSYPHAIATVLDTGGMNIDKVFIASHSGLMLFNGTYLPFDLSWKIKNIWDRITVAAYKTIQIAHDPIGKLVYVAVPLDGLSNPTHILVMDYTDCGPDLTIWHIQVKWSIWTLTNVAPTSMFIEEVSSVPNVLKLASNNNNIYALTPDTTNDNDVAIPTPFVQLALLPKGEDSSIYHFGGSQVRAVGAGTLLTSFISQDSVSSASGKSITLALAPGFEPFAEATFNSTQAMLKLALANINEYFKINRVRVYVKEIFKQLPG